MTQETGRIVNQIELKEVAGHNGEIRHVVNNAIAINRTKDKAVFIRFTAWGAQADFLKNYFKKGDPITLVGELMNDTYEKDDIKLQMLFLQVEKISFVPQTKQKEKEEGEEKHEPGKNNQ